MLFTPPKTAVFPALLPLIVLLGFSTSCSDEGAVEVMQESPTAKAYHVRGEIVSLPAAGSIDSPGSSLSIHHEPIPDFVDQHGDAVGMDAMTMPFPPAEGLDLDGFAVGDKVTVTFEVTWGGKNSGWQATGLEKLPAETELRFDKVTHGHDDHAGHNH